MNLFDCLLIAHFAGDWLLQNDWMARQKGRHLLGNALLSHCTIYTLCLLAALLLGTGIWPGWWGIAQFALFTFGSHWLIDGFGLAAHWSNLFRQTSSAFVRITVDQTLHLVVVGLLAIWLDAG